MGTTVKSMCRCWQELQLSEGQFRKSYINKFNKKYLHGNNENILNGQIQKMVGKKPKKMKKIEFQDFQIDGKLGSGGFGIVYLGQLKSNVASGKIEKYAIKKVSKLLLIKKKVFESAFIDKSILSTHNCNFIVTLIMAFQDPWYVYLVMECAIGGDTYSLIKENSPKLQDFKNLGETAIRFIAGCVILGLEFLHKSNYMYIDLKPENVLIFQHGYVKLTDFGLAKKYKEGELSKTISGTHLYYAPQMVLEKGYTTALDLWTFGIFLYELSNYEPPFTVDQITPTRFQAVVQRSESNLEWKNPNISMELKDLIHHLLKFNQKTRLGANGWYQIKEHQFFKNFDWKQLQQLKMKSPLQELVAKHVSTCQPYQLDLSRSNTKKQQAKFEDWTYVRKENLELLFSVGSQSNL